MKVRNLENARGVAVVNQFVIEDDNKKVFQSYDSTIVEVKWYSDFCEVNVGCDWDYSRTTTKYLKIFLMDEIGLTDEEVETIKKQLRKSDNDRFIINGRYVIYYCKDMR